MRGLKGETSFPQFSPILNSNHFPPPKSPSCLLKTFSSSSTLVTHMDNANFSVIPQGYTPGGDNFEQLWLCCARLLTPEFNCYEMNPPETWTSSNIDPCSQKRRESLSCIDKSRNWKAWEELLTCRETQRSMLNAQARSPTAETPISCHDQAITVSAYRDTFFNNLVTPEATKFTTLVGMSEVKIAQFNPSKDAPISQLCADLTPSYDPFSL